VPPWKLGRATTAAAHAAAAATDAASDEGAAPAVAIAAPCTPPGTLARARALAATAAVVGTVSVNTTTARGAVKSKARTRFEQMTQGIMACESLEELARYEREAQRSTREGLLYGPLLCAAREYLDAQPKFPSKAIPASRAGS
jgi:hypothetical protein